MSSGGGFAQPDHSGKGTIMSKHLYRAAAIVLAAASVASAGDIADFGLLAINPETTVGPDVPGFGYGTGDPMTEPPNVIYGGVFFTNDAAQGFSPGLFMGFNLPNIAVDPNENVVIRVRALDTAPAGGTARLELFDTDYGTQLNFDFDTTNLTTNYQEINLGTIASKSPSPDFDNILRGLQVADDTNQRSLEIDYIRTRPVAASTATIADFGTFATNPESTVGPDVPGFGFGTGDPMTDPPNVIYGGPVFTDDTVQSFGGGFSGFNLPNIEIDPTSDVIVSIRALDEGTPGNARLELFDTEYSDAVFLTFDTSTLTSEFTEINLGSVDAQVPSDNWDNILRGLQIVSDGNGRSFEIDYIVLRPAGGGTPDPVDGDADGDGDVDFDDLGILLGNYDLLVTPGSGGDSDNDGDVDFDDLGLLLGNYGFNTTPAQLDHASLNTAIATAEASLNITIPEPSAAALLAPAVLVLFRRQRR